MNFKTKREKNPTHNMYSYEHNLKTQVQFFSYIMAKNMLIFNEMMMRSALYWTNMLSWILIVLAHWNNSPRIDMSPHSITLSLFRVNQS
jgi:predicted class III extradiol MEMO1 family dioxygenase